jgi:hypothetical protein
MSNFGGSSPAVDLQLGRSINYLVNLQLNGVPPGCDRSHGQGEDNIQYDGVRSVVCGR